MNVNVKFKGVSGIYMIQNRMNGKVYIGRTGCFYRRCKQYVYAFETRKIKHINLRFLNAMVKYGIDNFEFKIIEITDNKLIYDRELFYINLYDSTNKNKGYNLRTDVGGKMVTHASTSIKISNNLKRQWDSGVRVNHSESLKKSWENKNRRQQSLLLTKNLTKYKYNINDMFLVSHKGLYIFGVQNVLSKFHRMKSDLVKYKGFKIERMLL